MARQELQIRVTGDAAPFKAAMDQVNSDLLRSSREAEKTSRGFTAFGKSLTSIGTGMTVGLTLPIVAAGTAAVKAAADMEKLNKGLASVMGSAAAGAAEMKKLQEAAKLPGLGLEGAVAGSIRLQVLGKTAAESRKIMAELGNAIALVGGGRDDFSEVTRQLGQMLSVGKVTKENLDTITERIPQISKIMIDTWGPQSVGDPAKFFERAGISSREFVDIIVSKLGEGARAGDTFANKMGNLDEAIKQTAARIGEKMLPALEKLLPKLEGLATGLADAVDGFLALPEPIKNASLLLVGLAVVAGPVITLIGKIVGAIGAIKGAVGVAGVALGALFGSTVIAMITQTMTAIDQLNARYRDLAKARDLVMSGKADPSSGLTESGRDLGKFKIDVKAIADELDLFGVKAGAAVIPVKGLDAAVGELTKKMPALSRVTADSEILMRMMSEATQAHATQLDKAADILRHYGTVSVDTALGLARVADEQFRLNRALEDAPDIHTKLEFKDIPKFEAPTLPVQLEPIGGSDKNVGPEGMLTKEQADAIKGRYKDVGVTGRAALQQVSLVINDLARGITDVIFRGGKLGDMFQSIASQAAQSITRLLIEGALTKLASKLLDVGGIMGKVFGGAGGAGGTIFSAAGSAGGGVAGSVGGASGGIGGALGGASSGLMGTLTAVSSIGSLISGIVGNFQNMAMNKSLDLIEHEVRFSQIHLLNTLNKANEFWPYMKLTWESLIRMEGRQGAPAGAGGVTVNMAGAYLLSDSAMDEFAERFARSLKRQGL